jgi:hypothetical protein
MRYGAKECLDRAKACDWVALQTKDRDARATFIELAKQWRELAVQKEDMEWNPPKLLSIKLRQ